MTVARQRRQPVATGKPEKPQYELPEPELVVIVEPEAGVRVTADGLTAAATDAPALQRAAGSGATLVPHFGAAEHRLLFEASVAAARGEHVPDLSRYYHVEGATDLAATASRLLKHDAVIGAYVKPPAEPAQAINDMVPSPQEAPPATPDFSTRQGYLDVAPGGIDARWAWTQAGGRGTGVQIIDIEGAWRFTHEDLLQNQGGVIGGAQSTDLGWRNHGTAVGGEFGGDDNGIGITGICPDAKVRAISIFGPGMGSAVAIRQAADALSAGDIILIELHRPGPRNNFQNRNDQLGYIAIEWWPDDFDAISYATGKGVIVVEAGGNGAENLDDALYNTPATGFPASWGNPFNRATRDSGAIVVGAGAPPPGTHGHDWGPDRSRLDFSNYGSVIDAQGWGREVTTTGYGDLQGGMNEDVWYTDQFSGTSSASPIVVGAVGAYQGIMRSRGTPLTPAQARNRLRTTGSPQQDAPGRPATQRIGNRPNLRQLVGKLIVKEKIEKIELKDHKLEKLEQKEHIKLEKVELKERKLEKVELKDRKLEKLEQKELEKIKPEIEGKGIREKLTDKLSDGGILGGIRGGGVAEGPPEDIATRLDRLEASVAQLSHFIGGELRPDLTQGALAQEPDLAALSQELAQAAADAKQAKDAKDVEKLSEL
jgi:Subtilase family